MGRTVWVQGDDERTNAASGDVVAVPAGEVVKVAVVLDDGTLAWRAEVAPDLLPGLPSSVDRPRRVEDAELLRAIDGVLAAERNRGG